MAGTTMNVGKLDFNPTIVRLKPSEKPLSLPDESISILQ